MSYFSKIFNPTNPAYQFIREIGEKELIKLFVTEDRKHCDVDLNRLFSNNASPEASFFLMSLYKERAVSHFVETFISSTIIGQGPKIYKPSQLTCEALENVALNIRLEDYHQPFPCMVIELPENYTQSRIVPCEQAGNETGLTYFKQLPEKHAPAFVAIYHDEIQQLFCTVTYFTTAQALNRFFWKDDESSLLEDYVIPGFVKYSDSLEVNEDERRATSLALKIGFNACLMLTDYGIKRIGFANPPYANRLQRNIEKSKKRKDTKHLFANEAELKSLPVYYDIEQNIRLYETETSHKRDAEGISDIVLKPHWRRGHWKRQHFGDNNSQTKRIFIKPVLVNAHSLQQGTNIKTTYIEK